MSKSLKIRVRTTGAALLVACCFASALSAADVDFKKQIQPIFKERCWECHGPEKRESGLRLDRKKDALAGGDTGKVIIPGEAAESLLIKYVSGDDPEMIMPPDGENLTRAEIELLTQWIDAGAEWPDDADPEDKQSAHWSYQPVTRPPVPKLQNESSVHNDLDRFVQAVLEAKGIRPSPEADRFTLIRRLSYDLLGLPPDQALVQRFLNDSSPDAYEHLVDELLASPHFGERWGRHWLDRARYADSDGYEKDNPRYNAWKYRDWVIQAVNEDMPFDQFTVEQLAGDLLPDATPSQVLATAFNRQTLTNTEGGTDKEQFRVEAVCDRIETISAVWLGLTMGCARCHSHKYDPISQREYYQLFAFFNNGDEVDRTAISNESAWAEYLPKKADYDRQLAELEAPVKAAREQARPEYTAWELAMRARIDELQQTRQEIVELTDMSVTSEGGATLSRLDDGSYLASGTKPAKDVYVIRGTLPPSATKLPLTTIRLDALTHDSLPAKGPGWSDNGNFVLSEISLETGPSESPVLRKFSAQADYFQKNFDPKNAIDGSTSGFGWAISPQMGQDHHAQFTIAEPIPTTEPQPITIRLAQQYERASLFPHPIGRFRIQLLLGDTLDSLDLPEPILKLFAIAPEKLTSAQREELFDHFASTQPQIRELQAKVAAHKKSEPFKPEMTVAVLAERTLDRRSTHIMRRGNFLEPLEEVEPGILRVLPEIVARDEQRGLDRLDLAMWLVSPAHPLTPRVTVNQIWSQLFGQGLVKTVNDFGVRGDAPSHPELLDWLASEFIARGWSRKQFLKLVLLSHTYRQSSAHRPELQDLDPNNRLLARQNRIRVEGEVVRDLYLAAGGRLDRRIGGPSVFPPLPPGIEELSYANNFKWGASLWNDRPDKPHGVAPKDDQWRRGMYTFFKRTAAHPTLVMFDCPDANTTCVERRVSNTPLQALATLNNVVFVESSRGLAERTLGEVTANDDDRLNHLFQICLVRPPASDELRALQALLADSRAFYNGQPDAAARITGRETAGEDVSELAAWTIVARMVLNLDEFITRD